MEKVRADLSKLYAESEVLPQKRIVAVNIPKHVEYKTVKDYLKKGEDEGKWVYEESCLAHQPEY